MKIRLGIFTMLFSMVLLFIMLAPAIADPGGGSFAQDQVMATTMAADDAAITKSIVNSAQDTTAAMTSIYTGSEATQNTDTTTANIEMIKASESTKVVGKMGGGFDVICPTVSVTFKGALNSSVNSIAAMISANNTRQGSDQGNYNVLLGEGGQDVSAPNLTATINCTISTAVSTQPNQGPVSGPELTTTFCLLLNIADNGT